MAIVSRRRRISGRREGGSTGVLHVDPGPHRRREGRRRQNDGQRRAGPDGRDWPACRRCSSRSRAAAGWRRCSATPARSATTRPCCARRRPPGAGAVRARTLTPDDALLEYLDDHGMRRISRRLDAHRAWSTWSPPRRPGIKDILVLGKVKQLERDRVADLIVVDAPAAGHAISFLQSARGLLDAVRVGPIRTQAQDVVDLLDRPGACQVILVTLPEETPVNELVETAYASRTGSASSLGPVVVNGAVPADRRPRRRPRDAAAAVGRRARGGRGAGAAGGGRVPPPAPRAAGRAGRPPGRALPLPQLHLPFLFTDRPRPAPSSTSWPAALTDGDRPTARRAAVAVARRGRCARLVGRAHDRRSRAGPGGVGKTTTAAALALEGARLGRRACVVTIDPAKRLADALGLESLTNTPKRIDGHVAGRAVGADARHQEHVRRPGRTATRRPASRPRPSSRTASTATSPARCRARRSTWRWRSSTSCTTAASFDLVVVDTPPTRNALDFLDAPRRLTRFLDNRLFRLLMMPTRAYLKAVSAATQTFLRTVSRVVGARRGRRRDRLLRGLRGDGGRVPRPGRRPYASC